MTVERRPPEGGAHDTVVTRPTLKETKKHERDRRVKFRYLRAAAGDLSENQHGAILRYGDGKPTTRGKEEETPTGPEWRQMEMKACG